MRFFLDMDGCITNLLAGIKMHPISKGIDVVNKDSHYDLHKLFNMEEEEFWIQFNDIEFWENLPKYSWSDELFNRLQDKFKENLFILTAPSKWATACATGKINWIKKNYPDIPVGRIILCNQKHLLAGVGNILLDDTVKKVNDFVDYGGHAILFPQVYNENVNEDDINLYAIERPKDIKEVYEIIDKF